MQFSPSTQRPSPQVTFSLWQSEGQLRHVSVPLLQNPSLTQTCCALEGPVGVYAVLVPPP